MAGAGVGVGEGEMSCTHPAARRITPMNRSGRQVFEGRFNIVY
jgi:hypothetical protein